MITRSVHELVCPCYDTILCQFHNYNLCQYYVSILCQCHNHNVTSISPQKNLISSSYVNVVILNGLIGCTNSSVHVLSRFDSILFDLEKPTLQLVCVSFFIERRKKKKGKQTNCNLDIPVCVLSLKVHAVLIRLYWP